MLRRATALSSVSIRNLLTVRNFCAPSSSSDGDQIITVRTTGIQFYKNGVSRSMMGVYWAKDDPRNTITWTNTESLDFKGVMLKSIVMALEQAKKDGVKKIHVQTDFKFMKKNDILKEMENLKKKDFALWTGKLTANSELVERILQLRSEMEELTLEYRSPYHKDRPGNEVAALIEETKSPPDSSVVNFTAKDYVSDWEITPTGALSLAGRVVPTVYVAGRLEIRPFNGFRTGSCASLWAPDTIENIEIKQRPIGCVQRPPIFPLTHFRMQLKGIHDAIREAHLLKIPEIRVITDSIHFVHFFPTGWKKVDGSPVANEKMYKKIKALTETMKVHFKAIKSSEDSDDELLKKVHEMTIDGLGYPIVTRDTKEYDMTIEELLAGRDEVNSVKGTSTRRARIIMRAKRCPPGVLWDRMDGVPLEGEEAEAAEACLQGIGKKTSTALLLAVLEHAEKQGLECIVIRTNQRSLVKATLAYLEVYHRYDWNDRNYHQLKEGELWKRIWEIKERMEIIWDLIDKVCEVDDQIYLAKYRKRPIKKAGRPKKKPKGLC